MLTLEKPSSSMSSPDLIRGSIKSQRQILSDNEQTACNISSRDRRVKPGEDKTDGLD